MQAAPAMQRLRAALCPQGRDTASLMAAMALAPLSPAIVALPPLPLAIVRTLPSHQVASSTQATPSRWRGS